MIAIQRGHIDIAAALIAHGGVDINVQDQVREITRCLCCVSLACCLLIGAIDQILLDYNVFNVCKGFLMYR